VPDLIDEIASLAVEPDQISAFDSTVLGTRRRLLFALFVLLPAAHANQTTWQCR
jgi:hypothetical protein